MPTLFYGEHQIPYTLKSSRRRRTLALQVNHLQQVTVLAPQRLSVPSIDRFLQARADWVIKKLHYFAEVGRQYPAKQYTQGESFLVRGKPCRLEVLVDPAYRRSKVERAGETLVVRVRSCERVEAAVRRWFKGEAAALAQEAVSRLAPKLGVYPKLIRIANQKRRWGSCSSRGHLRFNWRIAMMPEPIADYVVIHELAHMRVANHSAKFWSAVQTVLPDYKPRRSWLRANGMQFSVI